MTLKDRLEVARLDVILYARRVCNGLATLDELREAIGRYERARDAMLKRVA